MRSAEQPLPSWSCLNAVKSEHYTSSFTDFQLFSSTKKVLFLSFLCASDVLFSVLFFLFLVGDLRERGLFLGATVCGHMCSNLYQMSGPYEGRVSAWPCNLGFQTQSGGGGTGGRATSSGSFCCELRVSRTILGYQRLSHSAPASQSLAARFSLPGSFAQSFR